MRAFPLRSIRWSLVLPFAALALVPGAASAQAVPASTQAQASVTDERLTAYAKVFAEVARTRDEMQARLASPPNKTPEFQLELREELKTTIAELITAGGLTAEEYDRITWVVSTDDERRAAFDRILAELATAGEAEAAGL